MKWERMQKPLREGMQVFRMAWPESAYLMVEHREGLGEAQSEVQLFSDVHPEGVPFVPWEGDLDADDWAATGPSGV